MRQRFWARRISLIVCLLLLAGCDSLTGAGNNNNAQSNEPVALQVVRQSPEEVLRLFMEAWNNKDLRTMYSYVSPPSRELYPYEVFERRYTVAQDAMNFSKVSYEINQVSVQGVTAAVNYNAVLESPLFGSIEDPDRIMRLVQVDNGWQVAWSPMDILNGLASEASIQLLSRFPARASIYDRNGAYVVQQGGTIVSISAIKQDMRNVDACIDVLTNVMQVRRLRVARLFANYNADTFFYIGELDEPLYNAWQSDLENACALTNTSAGFTKITRYQNRSYIGHGSAAHITGYIGRIPGDQVAAYQARGYQAGDIVGVTGIEAAFQDELAGKPERYLRMVESGGATLRELGGTDSQATAPVQLTIDMRLQQATSQAIADAFNYAAINWATRASGAAAVVIKVNTGEILAMSSYPSFDPSVFNPDSSYTNAGAVITELVNDTLKPMTNKAVSEQYTPGSVYKIFTMVAADAEDVWSPEAIFDCDLLWYGGQRYGDALEYRQDWRVVDGMPAAGPIDMAMSLSTSCNPFFWEVGALMYRRNPNMKADYDAMFGFGSRTGFSLLGIEAQGSVARPNSIAEAINNSVGQGSVQSTALQMVTAVAAVANGGTLYAPYIVQQVGGLEGTPLKEASQPRVVRKMDIPPEVFEEVWRGMCNVTVDSNLGTGWRSFGGLQPLPYTSCGKTGTAQAGTAESGVAPNAWYVSFAPADNPEIATVVVVPTSREGSEVAAPITRRILDAYFNAPVAAYPEWWEDEYEPVQPPVGVSGQ